MSIWTSRVKGKELNEIYFAPLRSRLETLGFHESVPTDEIELFEATSDLQLCRAEVSAFANPMFSPWSVSAGLTLHSVKSAEVRNLLRIWESWNKVRGQQSMPLSPEPEASFLCSIRFPLRRDSVRRPVYEAVDYEAAGHGLCASFDLAWQRIYPVLNSPALLARFLETRGSEFFEVGTFQGQDALEHAAILRREMGQYDAAHRLISEYVESRNSPDSKIAVAEIQSKYRAWIDATSRE